VRLSSAPTFYRIIIKSVLNCFISWIFLLEPWISWDTDIPSVLQRFNKSTCYLLLLFCLRNTLTCINDAKKLRQAEYSAKLKRKDKGRHNNRYNPYYKNQDNSDKNTADLFRGSSPTRQGGTSFDSIFPKRTFFCLGCRHERRIHLIHFHIRNLDYANY
jgi:hypothetical protein